ncbi:hypothetical protein BH18CHL2_BH18CHL2_07930 [soil metagenome]
MAKTDDRPVDAGLALLKGKDETTAVAWWKERFSSIAAVPEDTARVGALTPTLRELTRITDEQERRRLTRARLIAFAQLPQGERDLIMAARKRAWEIDAEVLDRDQKLVDQLLPELDPDVRSAYPPPPSPR